MRVEARSLSKSFGAVQALDRVDFSIQSGARVALIGPNGSGKSTLVRAIAGLLRFEGQLLLDDVSPQDEQARVSQQIAYVPQSAPLLAAPVREVVRALASVRGHSVAGVEEVALTLGLDVREVAHIPLRGLSGGMRQKLLLAIALASRAELVMLDEPTASLDPSSRERFFACFEPRLGDATVLLCSHRLEEVRQLVDHVLTLEEGRIVYDGEAVEFLAKSTRALLEVRVSGPSSAQWLESHGFHPGRGSWWLRSVTQADKPALIRSLTAAIGEQLIDISVRDVETVDLGDGTGPGV